MFLFSCLKSLFFLLVLILVPVQYSVKPLFFPRFTHCLVPSGANIQLLNLTLLSIFKATTLRDKTESDMFSCMYL